MSSLISYGFLTPPAVLILLSAVGVWLALWRPHLGIIIAMGGTTLLYLAATPAVSSLMLREIEAKIPADPDLGRAQAIVVLGGDLHFGDGGKVQDTLGPLSWERVALAAHAYRQLHLKVAVSGGRVPGAHATEGALMKAALENDFSVPVTWNEDQSQTTFENALYIARLLKPDNVTTVVVVTQAWHMKRALWSFERVGLHALAWPAPRAYPRPARVDDILPSVHALLDSFYALHEALGMVYYRQHY